ncbi:2-amino-4-hydroxy-6-hydroxymethyldihydropteridine pyrophosphokinase [Pirellulimonas nuda]|uniref:2-amino-4-hydroxy-6-hydroxymethyldihydropteridine pyrophosphokinase n=1 Tax=Pirellulimonas nuda TaxID=2528009 RepID=A0A518D6J4_9BACT|nr:2-amino-4-hydroxy-6-hydroxymethyldihydropteridine diphosphokinase [Pirellulimonas nuda]QDU87097.1 2-amino-4-hydroxy-6-hydroxymethyldihydropteridine pyrophosphokinase [Pirellulimonas nuda]
MKTDCLIGMGANLGDRVAAIEGACSELASVASDGVVRAGAWRTTAPIGGPAGQEPFLNGAVRLTTEIDAAELHDLLASIEEASGRQRRTRWGARTLDLDLLLFGDLVLQTPRLTVPHPRMSYRPFVLAPAAEAAPDMRHPLLGCRIDELWNTLQHGADHVLLLGESQAARRVERLLGERHPSLSIERDAAGPLPRLVIDARGPGAPGPVTPAPTLWLSDADAAHFDADLLAAVACVWPDAAP